jgi:hypothetical protein
MNFKQTQDSTFHEINTRDRYNIEIVILSESTSHNVHVGERLCAVQTPISTCHAPQRDTCNASVKEFQTKFKEPDSISRIRVWARRRWLNPNDIGFNVSKDYSSMNFAK